MSDRKPLSSEIYGNAAFAQQYAANIIDNAWNAYYERPASLSLMPADNISTTSFIPLSTS